MNNIKLPSVVTIPSIYHGCSTWKMFWEGNFMEVNMKNCGLSNVRKHREVKNSKQYIALDISLKFGNMDKIKIKSSEPRDCLLRSVEGLIASLGPNTIRRLKKS